jgi:hypothetical protein
MLPGTIAPDDWMVDEEGSGRFKKSTPHSIQKNKALAKKVWQAEEILAEFEEEGIDWAHCDFKNKFPGIKSKEVFEFY